MLCALWTPESCFDLQQNLSSAIRRTALGPGVCPCIHISFMMRYVHTGEAVVTSIKIDIFGCHPKAYSTLRMVCMHLKLCW